MRGLAARDKCRDGLAGQVTSSGNASLDVHVDEKHERRRLASLPVFSIFKNCNKLALKQFLVRPIYTSEFLELLVVAPKFIQFCFKYVSKFSNSMHNIIRLAAIFASI